jgi:hypothetical protein
MSRQMRVEFLSVAIKAGPRTLSPTTVAKLRVELARLAASPDLRVRRFVAAMRERYPGIL